MKLLVAGGGTGGHLFVGIAIAEEIRARGGEVLFVGSAQGIEKRVVPAAGYPLELLQVSGLVRVGVVQTMRGVARLPSALGRAQAILRRFAPDVVLGVGGYASGPMVLVAALAGCPTAIQEQNSVPGITNRILGRVVRQIYLGFSQAKVHFAEAKCVYTGNPVRAAFLSTWRAGGFSAQSSVVASQATQVRDGRDARVLVVGGSQGAHAINLRVAEAMEILNARGHAPYLIHQSGSTDVASLCARYERTGLTARVEVVPFIDDMVAAYRAADLVVARAGALTLAELAVAGRPALLIPLPTAAGDHQSRNADVFASAGAARVLRQADATPERLAEALHALLIDGGARQSMGQALRGLARPLAAQQIADALEALAALGR